jgi:DNA-binding transcriptional LysR family regulator
MISASARRLTVFKSIVDHGGFNLAAMQLGIAQPSVGAHIKALETQLGQPLFHRARGRKPRLTKAGEAVYAYAVDVLQRSEAAAQTLRALGTTADELTIAAHRDVASHFLPPRIAAFNRRFPKVHVITRIGTIDEVVDLVRAESAAVGLFLGLHAVSGLRSHVLAREPLMLVAAPGHPLAKDRNPSARRIAGFPFVTGLRGSRFFQLTDSALKQIGVAQYEIGMEVAESSATKEILRHGEAIACLPRFSVARELATGALIALTPSCALMELELRCGYVGQLNDTARHLLRFLRRDGVRA